MIAGLKGYLEELKTDKVLINVSGVIYDVNISFKTYDELTSKIGNEIKLLIYHSISERTEKLFGFLQEKEREVFIRVRNLPGIGEMTALRVLSFLSPEELIDCVKREDKTKLEKIPKIKGKTSEKILFEISQNLKKFEVLLGESQNKTEERDDIELSVLALLQLGFDQKTAEKEVRKIISANTNMKTAEIIKEVLKASG